MMSKKQLACMLTLHIIYLLLGASIFYHIESPLEMLQRAEEKLERLEIQNLLYENYIPTDPDKQDSILKKLSDYCGKSMFNYTTEDEEPPIKWDFYHSFFFSYTVVSTIGYGNLAPTTHLSRILMIFYGLFGIPINGILLANLGEYFGVQLIRVYRRYKRRDAKRANMLDYFFHNLGMLGQIFLYLVPGFLFFIFLPACIFVVFEGWDFVASIYYAFVTLTTIGFGDLVAGTINNGFAPGLFISYEIFLIVWITFGLGYIVMLLGFITSGMRSESVHKIEKKLASQLKSTQNRILQGFTKDISVIRKLINEANLIKLKPVYIEPAPYLIRSKSCPIFTYDVEPRGPIVKRKRANSENIQLSARDMLRIQSDTDLLGIDKEKTFTASAIVKPAELLARVVNVLGGLDQQQREEKGVHMFEDNEILASEKPPMWSIGQENIITGPVRNRALSVAVPNHRKDSFSKLHHELTWSNGDSPDKHKEVLNYRSGKLSLPSTVAPFATDDLQPKSILSKGLRRPSTDDNPADYLKNTMKGRVSNSQAMADLTKPRRGSIFPQLYVGQEEQNIADSYKEKTKRGRRSIFPNFNFSEDEDEQADAVKAYKQKSKRHSIFPTFDFSEDDDDDMANKYKETTKRGRRSIFPTFDFSDDKSDEDDTIDEDEVRKYQSHTSRGRMSLFPTFGKSKKPTEPAEEEENDDTIDEDEVLKYQNKTRSGRLSLFPTFGKSKKPPEPKEVEENDDTVDEDEVLKYQNKTRSGRLSLFPTFGKSKKPSEPTEAEENDDTIDEDEVLKYQNKTKSGRLSLFPTFGKSKKPAEQEEEKDDTIDEDEVLKYQNKTKSGRLSLFPTFGKSKKSSDTEGRERKPSGAEESDLAASIREFQNKNKVKAGKNNSSRAGAGKTSRGRRGSLFDDDVSLNDLGEEEQVEALEQTSVADLLRALALLETACPSGQRGSMEAPGLLELLGGAVNTGPPATRRRGSVHPDFALPNFIQRNETRDADGPPRRRVSARAATPHFTPSLATVVAGSELQSTATAAREHRMMMTQPPPPYSETDTEAEPQPPRVRRFSPAPVNTGRTSTGPIPRLYSRMRKESETVPEEDESSRRGSLTDIVIDNNKDKT